MESNTDLALARQLLVDAVAAAEAAGEGGKKAVADRLGYGRSLISRVLSPNDKLGISGALAKRIIDFYHVVAACPATGTTQRRSECMRLALGPAPTHHPGSMRTWKTCQTCPHKPSKEGCHK